MCCFLSPNSRIAVQASMWGEMAVTNIIKDFCQDVRRCSGRSPLPVVLVLQSGQGPLPELLSILLYDSYFIAFDRLSLMIAPEK